MTSLEKLLEILDNFKKLSHKLTNTFLKIKRMLDI